MLRQWNKYLSQFGGIQLSSNHLIKSISNFRLQDEHINAE